MKLMLSLPSILINLILYHLSGQLAPFAMLLCCIALMPFRGIFKECGTAVPMVNITEYISICFFLNSLFLDYLFAPLYFTSSNLYPQQQTTIYSFIFFIVFCCVPFIHSKPRCILVQCSTVQKYSAQYCAAQ